MYPKTHYVDFAIITALPLEMLAALKIFDNGYDSIQVGSRLYQVGNTFDKTQTKEYKILISMTDYYGAVTAASLATEIKLVWNPRFFIVVGIAGGLPDYVKLGSVVISNSILEIFFQKIRKGSQSVEERQRRHDVSSYLLTYFESPPLDWHQYIGYEISENMIDELKGEELPYKPKHYIGKIISSNAVVASTEIHKELIANYTSAIALEMEGYGVAQASRISRRNYSTTCLIVKGVSDLADDKKADSAWRDYAAFASVAYVRAIIKTGKIEVSPKQEYDYPIEARQANAAERENWFGDMYYAMGEYNKAIEYYENANHLLNKLDENRYIKITLRSDINYKLSNLLQRRGKVKDAALHLALAFGNWQILGLEERMGILAADFEYLQGLIERENGNIKEASERLDKAADLYEKARSWLGYTNAIRWKGYIFYGEPTRDYMEAYKWISLSHKQLIENTASENKMPEAAESYDMMSRVLREIASEFRENPVDYQKAKQAYHSLDLPDNVEDCRKQALEFMKKGKEIAEKSDDKYKLAESYLSYVIYYDRESNITSPEEIKKPLLEAYNSGIKITQEYQYYLLTSIFEKYVGNLYFNLGEYENSFEHYAARYCASLYVRNKEQGRAKQEIKEKFQFLDGRREECFRHFIATCDMIDTSSLEDNYWIGMKDAILSLRNIGLG